MRQADRLLEDEKLLSLVYKLSCGGIPKAALAGVWDFPPRWFCACCCSSISATAARIGLTAPEVNRMASAFTHEDLRAALALAG
jgi:hypothetical protein